MKPTTRKPTGGESGGEANGSKGGQSRLSKSRSTGDSPTAPEVALLLQPLRRLLRVGFVPWIPWSLAARSEARQTNHQLLVPTDTVTLPPLRPATGPDPVNGPYPLPVPNQRAQREACAIPGRSAAAARERRRAVGRVGAVSTRVFLPLGVFGGLRWCQRRPRPEEAFQGAVVALPAPGGRRRRRPLLQDETSAEPHAALQADPDGQAGGSGERATTNTLSTPAAAAALPDLASDACSPPVPACLLFLMRNPLVLSPCLLFSGF